MATSKTKVVENPDGSTKEADWTISQNGKPTDWSKVIKDIAKFIAAAMNFENKGSKRK